MLLPTIIIYICPIGGPQRLADRWKRRVGCLGRIHVGGMVIMSFDLARIDRIAVVGASRDREKYGYKGLMDLHNAGFQVCGINPNCTEIDGVACYPDLDSLPWSPELVVMVVPPGITEKVVREAVDAGVKRIWMQPGSESPEAIALCEAEGIELVYNACIMIYRKKGILAEGE